MIPTPSPRMSGACRASGTRASSMPAPSGISTPTRRSATGLMDSICWRRYNPLRRPALADERLWVRAGDWPNRVRRDPRWKQGKCIKTMKAIRSSDHRQHAAHSRREAVSRCRSLGEVRTRRWAGRSRNRIGLAMIEAAERDGEPEVGRRDRRADVGQHRHRLRRWRPRSRGTS